jgi:hypothetical protein
MKTSSPFRTKFNRDGSVTIWSVYRQQWERMPASEVSDETLASLPAAERERIIRMAAR